MPQIQFHVSDEAFKIIQLRTKGNRFLKGEYVGGAIVEAENHNFDPFNSKAEKPSTDGE